MFGFAFWSILDVRFSNIGEVAILVVVSSHVAVSHVAVSLTVFMTPFDIPHTTFYEFSIVSIYIL